MAMTPPSPILPKRRPLWFTLGIGVVAALCLCGFLATVRSQASSFDPLAGKPVTVVFVVATATPNQPDRGAITVTSVPTDVPTPVVSHTPVVTLTPVAAEPSKGLGMSTAAWEAKEGEPVKKGMLTGQIYKSGVEAGFIDERISRIDLQLPRGQTVSASDAHAMGKLYIPNDATLVKTYHPEQRPETTVNLYQSAWLAERFAADAFVYGELGQFTLQYNVYEGKVSSVTLSLGNAP